MENNFINKILDISREMCFFFLNTYLNTTNMPESEIREIVSTSIKDYTDT